MLSITPQTETKYCNYCKTTKSIEFFSRKGITSKGLTKYQGICKSCRKIWFKSHYSENKSYYLQRNKDNKIKLANWFREYKSKLICINCGENSTCTLDFHHLDPTQKDHNISELMNKNSPKLLEKEISKCIVLCSNCHRKVHAGLLEI